MHARSGAFQLPVENIDGAVSRLEEEHLPRYREQDGYKGFTVLVNRESGKVFGVSFWEDEEALRASESLGQEARDTFQSAGEGEAQRDDWEVVIDDMV